LQRTYRERIEILEPCHQSTIIFSFYFTKILVYLKAVCRFSRYLRYSTKSYLYLERGQDCCYHAICSLFLESSTLLVPRCSMRIYGVKLSQNSFQKPLTVNVTSTLLSSGTSMMRQFSFHVPSARFPFTLTLVKLGLPTSSPWNFSSMFSLLHHSFPLFLL